MILIADSFRPAMFVPLNSYSKPKNKTRSLTLIRLAINLGFSAGPAIGGLIITSFGYISLFWIDGITCLLGSTLLVKVLSPKKSKITDKTTTKNPQSVFSDKIF
ncbi:MFS transporter [Tenacibaculum sp. C7A-26P2]|uniref:MFS transporter n=1 Tax=Tenacibaculum sp. C7A-26P2 TaxID=3447504 RepID=UPI003F86C94C